MPIEILVIKQVAVGVQSDLHGGVTELCGDVLDILPGQDPHGSVCMPQAVK